MSYIQEWFDLAESVEKSRFQKLPWYMKLYEKLYLFFILIMILIVPIGIGVIIGILFF